MARRALFPSFFVFVVVAGWSPGTVDARPIITNPIEDVLVCASDVVRVSWWTKPKPPDPEIQRVFRGDLEVGTTVHLHSVPQEVTFEVVRGSFRPGLWGDREKVEPVGLIVALYEMDGRHYVVGERPTHRIAAHSSTWIIGNDGNVYTFQQVINPGSPVPVAADPAPIAEFEAALVRKLKAHPFKGADHRSVPEAHRAAFRKVTEPAIDWYERRLDNYEMIAFDRVKLADQIMAYMEKAPKEMAIHAFDALQIIAPSNYAATEHEDELVEYMTRLVKRFGVETFDDLILYELDKGPYFTRNRSVLLAVAKRTDPNLAKKAVDVLVALGKRQHYNEGCAAYFALLYNGEKELAEEVQKVQGWK